MSREGSTDKHSTLEVLYKFTNSFWCHKRWIKCYNVHRSRLYDKSHFFTYLFSWTGWLRLLFYFNTLKYITTKYTTLFTQIYFQQTKAKCSHYLIWKFRFWIVCWCYMLLLHKYFCIILWCTLKYSTCSTKVWVALVTTCFPTTHWVHL